MSTLLTIAGFDPSSGAGITADLAVFAAHGMFGVSALTALTVQSTIGVRSIHPVDGVLLGEMLEELQSDLPADGIKIGVLASSECVAAVIEFIQGLHRTGRTPILVLDPVLRSSSGRALLDEAGVDLLRSGLLPLVQWATPNVEELAVLGGWRSGFSQLATKVEITAAARRLQDDYAGLGLVITGGHMEPPDDLLLLSKLPDEPASGLKAETAFWLKGNRVQTSSTHGTGCAFSSAFLSRLVSGEDPLAAARAAKHYVSEAMRRAVTRGGGHGPMNLLWPM